MTRRLPLLALATALAFLPSLAAAHAGEPLAPHDLWRAWNLNPMIVLPLAVTGWLYARGVSILWERAGRGRGVRRWQASAFAAGLSALAVALISPLDALSAALFSAHMAQHLLLVMVAAPLLVLGAPLVPFLWALPRSWRMFLTHWSRRSGPRMCWRPLTIPVVVWTLHVLMMWAWHAPVFYEAALNREAVHILEHASFLGSALLFWWLLIQAQGRRRLGPGSAMIFILAASVQGTVLGALITFSGAPWYPAYADSAPKWGLTPLADQQLAGVLMWVLMGMVYLATALALVVSIVRGAGQPALPGERDASWPPVARPGGV